MANFFRNMLSAAEKRVGPVPSRPELWLQGAALFLNAVLVIALARALASLTVAVLWGGSNLPIGTVASTEPTLSSGETAMARPVDFSTIGAWHLFGRLEAGQPVAAPAVPVPATSLNLRLVGVFFVERYGEKALALIAEGTGLERGYRIGESLPGGARLERVQRDSVIVTRGGQQEVLNLPRLDSIGKMPVSEETPPAMPIDSGPIPEPGMTPEPEVMPEPATFREPRVIDATAVAARLRGVTSNRPQALEDIAFASPYVRDGQFLGFRLRPGRDRQLMQQLGFSSGDVITEVNGSRLNNPMQGLAVLRELLNAEQINVRVLRNGTEIPLAFSLGGPGVE